MKHKLSQWACALNPLIEEMEEEREEAAGGAGNCLNRDLQDLGINMILKLLFKKGASNADCCGIA